MEISGKVIQINPEVNGEGRNGPWRKQEVIIETQEQYPKKVCVSIWGDKIDQFGLNQGEGVTFSVNIESREYNSRWYTDIRAWKVDKSTSSSQATEDSGSSHAEPDHVRSVPPPTEEDQNTSSNQVNYEDDLPF